MEPIRRPAIGRAVWLLRVDRWGDASYGARYPEQLWKKGFAPRVGVAYSSDNNTVIRAGYGIFYSSPIYPGWSGGIAQHGFNTTINFN